MGFITSSYYLPWSQHGTRNVYSTGSKTNMTHRQAWNWLWVETFHSDLAGMRASGDTDG